MIAEEIQEVGKREDVHRSAKQYEHLLIATNQVSDEISGSSGWSSWRLTQALQHTLYKHSVPLGYKGTKNNSGQKPSGVCCPRCLVCMSLGKDTALHLTSQRSERPHKVLAMALVTTAEQNQMPRGHAEVPGD